MQKIKGTYDVYGDLALRHEYIKKLFSFVASSYNYNYIETPLIEKSELFHRGVGETSDIVKKETYDFVDRGGRNNTIRPEGTAGVARAIIENKLYTSVPLKFYYMGSMYRYERPGKGRYRELRQLGVEAYGSNKPIMDAENISLGYNFLKELGLKDITVKINSIGGTETRKKYREDLINHFKNNIDEFCDDCKERIEKNPLRILDCKVDAENELIKNAPSILDYLNEEEENHFNEVLEYLKELDIDFEIDNTLVRGLDYYTNTVFEYVSKDNSFGSLGGGGRYDNLLESLGGPSTPAVGFALGFDRIVDLINKLDINLQINNEVDVYLLTISENENKYAMSLAQDLRMCGYRVDMDLSGKSMKAKFKETERYNTKFTIVIGEEEVKSNNLTVKDNLTKEERKVEVDNLIDFLDTNI